MDKKQLLSLLTPLANASVPVRIMKYFDGFYFLVGTFSLENGVSDDNGCFYSSQRERQAREQEKKNLRAPTRVCSLKKTKNFFDFLILREREFNFVLAFFFSILEFL